jgi:putative FmdB family regulatory protein
MPLYEYYCRDCESTFEKLRPVSASDQAADCPAGHTGAARTLSLIATLRKDSGPLPEAMGGGGCCGGGCACGSQNLN